MSYVCRCTSCLDYSNRLPVCQSGKCIFYLVDSTGNSPIDGQYGKRIGCPYDVRIAEIDIKFNLANLNMAARINLFKYCILFGRWIG